MAPRACLLIALVLVNIHHANGSQFSLRKLTLNRNDLRNNRILLRTLPWKRQRSWKAAFLARGGARIRKSPGTSKAVIITREDTTSVGNKLWDIIKTYWYLGLIGFGGTPAHVAILKNQCKSWLSEDKFVELLAAVQAMPGPSSTQLLIATAAAHAGVVGGLVAFILWSLPGFLVLTLAGLARHKPERISALLQGIPPVTLVLSLKSVTRMVSSLDGQQRIVAIVSCALATLSKMRTPKTRAQFVFPALLVLGGLLTFLEDFRKSPAKL